MAIAINIREHRNDSTESPRVSISGYSGTAFIKLADWQYFEAVSDFMPIEPNNRSLKECPIYLRDCNHNESDWVLDAPSGDFSIVPTSPNGFYRNGGDVGGSWSGGYLDARLDGDIVTIQATAVNTSRSAGISLQDTPFVTHNYFAPTIAHSIIFGQEGKLSIFELGEAPKSLVSAVRYDDGDTAMIELDRIKNLVKYYLIKDGEMILLRTTRPKLTTDPVAEFLLFFPTSVLHNILFTNGDEVKTTFENIGVAYGTKGQHDWQKWNNQRSRVSNADPIQLADGQNQFTFPNSKRVLRSLNLTPKALSKTGFQIFEDFFNWHGTEKEFIFVDNARQDALGNKQEFWARFTFGSPFTDQTGNGCVFENGAQIIEAYRSDYVPKLIDETSPLVSLGENYGGFGFAIFDAETYDNVGVEYAQIFVDGIQVGGNLEYSGSNTFTFNFDISGYSSGSYPVVVHAYDYAGNVGISNTQTLTI